MAFANNNSTVDFFTCHMPCEFEFKTVKLSINFDKKLT